MRVTFLALLATVHAAGYKRAVADQQADVLQFENFGYLGRYNLVESLSNVDSDSCTCELSTSAVEFSGATSPLDGEVSVHFRGPLVLSKFAAYVSPNYVHGTNNGTWQRNAYYDSSSGTTNNVTFLTTAGANSSCLGKALTFADTDGVSAADLATVLADNTLIKSNDEYSIFSNITCGKSGFGNDCGVYRDGIPAYHGFYGATKMFLFEFQMPKESSASSDIANYNMPAIWLLNANIPRTAQYSMNANCSCWRSGCGEFDIFEVKNTTLANNLYATIHDYQGTGDIELGLQVPGYISRDYSATYKGGVTFDSDGNAIVFVSNSTTFDATIDGSDLNSWISGAGKEVTDLLSSVSLAPSSSKSSSKKSAGFSNNAQSFMTKLWVGAVGLVLCVL